MKRLIGACELLLAIAATASILISADVGHAKQLLIADRVNDNVYRYGGNGQLINTVITDTTGLLDPSGLALSPDSTKLYVTSSGNNSVIQYDYDFATGTASNPTTFADATDGLAFPSGIKFSPDGDRIYVANLNGTGVAQFATNGDVAGFPLFGSSIFAYSGLAFGPNRELLVGGFSDNVGQGGVLKADGPGLVDLVAPSLFISGAAGMLVNGDDLYVTGLFAGTLLKYDVNSGGQHFGFGVTGLESPQALIHAPRGPGFLVGILGEGDGEGYIERYDFDGTSLGIFASPSAGGFAEATAFISIVPEPASVVSLVLGGVGLLLNRRRIL